MMNDLETARTCLQRAIDADRSLLRFDYLYCARDALIAAHMPGWADIAEAGAQIGGSGLAIERLLFDVECVMRRESRDGI